MYSTKRNLEAIQWREKDVEVCDEFVNGKIFKDEHYYYLIISEGVVWPLNERDWIVKFDTDYAKNIYAVFQNEVFEDTFVRSEESEYYKMAAKSRIDPKFLKDNDLQEVSGPMYYDSNETPTNDQILKEIKDLKSQIACHVLSSLGGSQGKKKKKK